MTPRPAGTSPEACLAALWSGLLAYQPDLVIVNSALHAAPDSEGTDHISPERLSKTLSAMVDREVKSFLEVGPGRVIAGLVRQVDRSLPVTSMLDEESVDEFVRTIG